MVRSRTLIVVPPVLLCGLLAGTYAQSNPTKRPQPDAASVMEKVRDTYRNLAGYHFERVVLAQEASSDGTLATLAELTLVTATENAKPQPNGERFPPLNTERFRMGTRTKRGETLQLCDGRTCWSYTSLKNEFMTGERYRDVNTSVGGAMLTALHLFTFSALAEGAIQDARVVREEEIAVGMERRRCYVIEGTIPVPPLPSGPGKPSAPPTLGMFWFLSMLSLQGLAEEKRTTMYSPWVVGKESSAGEPTQATLWIDQDTHVLVRSKMSGWLYKRLVTKDSQAIERIAVNVTNSFTIAAVKAPSTDLFSFTPPPGAKEVPNVASRREKKD